MYSFRAGPCEASPQRLGPRFTAPFPAEYRFSNSTGGWLHCVSQGQPQPRVTWLLADGREAQPLGGLRRALPNGTLHFPPFRAAQFSQDVHGASYRCRATNLFGTVVSTEVRVRGVVEQYYEVQVYDEFTIAGNTAVLRCHVPSFVKEDVVVVSWEHKLAQKTEVITTGGRMSVFPSGELHVRRVQPSDASADFRCRTWHRLTGETKLSSYGRLVVTDLKVNVPPRITNVRSTVVARDGDTVELPCAAQGYPPPKYLWERLPTSDSLSSRRSVLAGSSRFEPSDGSLIIRKVEPEDAGKYLCLVSNGVGEERATVTLDVQAPLRVSLSPEVLTAHVGHPAVFRCAVSGRPAAEVRWAKDGIPLVIDRARIQLLDERQALRIGSVDTRDGGMYQCAASNAHESAQGTAQLILGGTPRPEDNTTLSRLHERLWWLYSHVSLI
ncbi:Down syndrome cell adhesion molecule-like protein Dscam2 [Ixodes scapularis]